MFNVDILRYLVEKCNADICAEPVRLVENAIIKDNPEVLDYLLQQLQGDEVWWHWGYKFPGPLHEALNYRSVTCISVLLRWGLNNAVFNIPALNLGYILKHFLFVTPHKHVSIKDITVIKLLKQLYPHSLQDEWLIWYIKARNDDRVSFCQCLKNALDKFLVELYRESKNPSRLNVMCRTKIFQQLGYNPIPKAKKLSLPRNLINFVRFRDIEDLYVM